MWMLTDKERSLAIDAGFDAYGLRHSIKELQSFQHQNKTIQDMANYVDVVTYIKTNSNDNEFLKQQLNARQTPSQINVTALGNLAYIALQSKDAEIAQLAKTLYYKCFKMYSNSKCKPKTITPPINDKCTIQ